MKTQPEPNTSGEATPGAPIALVPPPTDAEQLATARNEITLLHDRLADAARKNQALLDKLAELERNAFSNAMAYIDGGGAVEDAGLAMQTLCAAVLERQEKGSLALKIAVKPFKNALVMTAEVKVTEPKKEPAQSIFYLNPEGGLQRNDPTQAEFRFRNAADGDEDVTRRRAS